ncbi:MAG: DVUA0089 family protein [Bryobacteraceae bacterium]
MRLLAIKALGIVVLAASLASAANFSFQGTFTRDDEVQLFTFSVASTSTVTLRTWSYAGGVNAGGRTIARGGFDPILALFNSSGVLINENDDGGFSVPADPVTNQNFDTYLQSSLSAGTYTVSVMQYDNFANGSSLSQGFSETGNPTFTSVFGCSSGRFCDVSGVDPGDNRNGAWAFDVLGVDSASVTTTPSGVPEPATVSLMIAGLGLVALVGKRRLASATR